MIPFRQAVPISGLSYQWTQYKREYFFYFCLIRIRIWDSNLQSCVINFVFNSVTVLWLHYTYNVLSFLEKYFFCTFDNGWKLVHDEKHQVALIIHFLCVDYDQTFKSHKPAATSEQVAFIKSIVAGSVPFCTEHFLVLAAATHPDLSLTEIHVPAVTTETSDAASLFTNCLITFSHQIFLPLLVP